MKAVQTFLIIISRGLLLGCSEDSLLPDYEKSWKKDSIAGEYLLEGTQINQRVCSPPYFGVYDCEPGEPL